MQRLLYKTVRYVLILWFRAQAARAAKGILTSVYEKEQVASILQEYWKCYLLLKPEVPPMPTLGGSLMVHLAAMSTAFYQEMTKRGHSPESATQLFYDIAWRVYQKMGKLSWRLAGIGNQAGYGRLLRATRLFRTFPFNSPSYIWHDAEPDGSIVGFDCLKCPVAEYFNKRNLSEFCTATWCALDFPLAEMWEAELVRTGSIAGGARKCDFRWTLKSTSPNV